jgi:hypothetical protein
MVATYHSTRNWGLLNTYVIRHTATLLTSGENIRSPASENYLSRISIYIPLMNLN